VARMGEERGVYRSWWGKLKEKIRMSGVQMEGPSSC
jgi:hypothetical protein